MKSSSFSFGAALLLSAAAWLTELWRAWLDMLLEYPRGDVQAQVDGANTLVLTLIYTAVFAGWAYALHLAARGNRGGLIAALVLNTLVWLAMPVGWLTAYCTGACPSSSGLFYNLANWLNLVFGLLAALALLLQLRAQKLAAGASLP